MLNCWAFLLTVHFRGKKVAHVNNVSLLNFHFSVEDTNISHLKP